MSLSASEAVLSIENTTEKEKQSVMPALLTWVQGLGGAPDVPHAADMSSLAEGSGVGKVKEPPVCAGVDYMDNELDDLGSRDAAVLVFKLRLTENMEVRWETLMHDRKLYIQVPNGILPDGSKEGFVSLLEYAEEELKCTHVIVFFKKDRSDRACLVRTFMFLGFVVLAPGHQLCPTTDDSFYMAYVIE